MPHPLAFAAALRPPARHWLGVALALALAGCASGQRPQVPSLVLPPVYDDAGRAQLPPAALDAWWRGFDDAQLQALVERALDAGVDARLALARLDEARAIRGQALSAYAPQGALRASAERTRSRDLDDGPDPADERARSASLPVGWELDLFGRRAAARTAADADLAAARFQYEAARAAVAAKVAQTLFEARGLAARLDDARENERIQGALAELLRRRVERGLAAAADGDRVGAELARSQAERLALQAELDAARRALLVLSGDAFAPAEALPLSAELGAAPEVPATLPGDLLDRRPDVRQAQARIHAAAGAVRLAELDFFPKLTLQATPGVSWQRGALDASRSFWTLGAGLAVPVLDRPRLLAALDLQGARGQQAALGYEQAVQAAFAEADQALLRLAAARKRAHTLDDGELRARRAFDAAQVRFQRGLGDLQALLDAEAAWRATRSARTAARLDALLGAVQACKALGGGWSATAPGDA
ncbi:efflux transporter outer membrane subunit [Lysobacter enzymogenes]|uniref:efflux transporter outer membrane subunit n=1 Tax=Lysobacter enzymogenes TaxID=69 RepID=UPI001AF4B709|nr:TolC family protein [Lysobacter enzymogenes]QQQ03719.1 TolC family protein [Lysobacter enzymogenes]